MAQSKEERVHQVFEKIYENYDSMNSVISFNRHKAWRKDTMKRMGVKNGAKSLDLCCGTGDWSIAMGEEVGPNGEVVGLDFSENMLKIGKEKLKGMDMDNVSLIHGNAMSLPFEDNSFDYVTIGFGLRNVPDYMQVLKEMHRVLKPGGKAVCLETSQPTMPVFKQFYYFYFKKVMPVMGKLLAKSYQEYSWLQESASEFPDSRKLAEMFKESGFVNVEVKQYTGGVAAMHLGYKPKA
ncbi:demethylmenaquinone methyltransferase [Bacillus marinisedimentorum]|uniref:demethylmenaquinone methyltransferase n=1 Tax=Bacillus marinisedimentorum TaxID=1821260 RepID=UPI00087280A6|nr:demethylmenaquinone methyltransferase [Bacillus marinisedimentorum]